MTETEDMTAAIGLMQRCEQNHDALIEFAQRILVRFNCRIAVAEHPRHLPDSWGSGAWTVFERPLPAAIVMEWKGLVSQALRLRREVESSHWLRLGAPHEWLTFPMCLIRSWSEH